MQLTYTVNGEPVVLEGTAAELAEAITTLVVPAEKAKAAPKAPKAAPKVERKTDGIGEGKALTKGTRRAFGEAYLKAFGEAPEALAEEIGAEGTVLHWSTKNLATLAIATNQTPKGYRVAAGYYQLLGAEAKEAVAKAKANLEAPKAESRQRDAKGRFVKS